MAGNTNEGRIGEGEYRTTGRQSGWTTYLSEISWGDMGWDGIGYTNEGYVFFFFFSFFSFLSFPFFFPDTRTT